LTETLEMISLLRGEATTGTGEEKGVETVGCTVRSFTGELLSTLASKLHSTHRTCNVIESS
jgi:hypothetical protein